MRLGMMTQVNKILCSGTLGGGLCPEALSAVTVTDAMEGAGDHLVTI